MISPRFFKGIASPASNHYHQVIEESYRPAMPDMTFSTAAGPSAKTDSATHVPERFVETLRAQGISVRARHYRWVIQEGMAVEPILARISKHDRKALAADLEKPYPPTILQNGGETHVTVTMPDGREAQGVFEFGHRLHTRHVVARLYSRSFRLAAKSFANSSRPAGQVSRPGERIVAPISFSKAIPSAYLSG